MKKTNLNRIYINKAKEQKMELKLENIKNKLIPIKFGEENNIKIEINVIYSYEAPVDEQTKIGNIIVKKNEKIIETIDIVCNKKVEKMDVLSYIYTNDINEAVEKIYEEITDKSKTRH